MKVKSESDVSQSCPTLSDPMDCSLESSVGKESTHNAGDLGSIPGLGRSSGEGKGYPLQYSGLENSMNCIVRGVAKSRIRLSDLHNNRPRILEREVRGP